MGCFSWKFCDVKQGQRDARRLITGHRGYLLVPAKFGGGSLVTSSYNGYGIFSGKDAYELAADWNRQYIAAHPEHLLPDSGRMVREMPWYRSYSDLSLSPKEVEEAIKKDKGCSMEYRWIGIELACMDKDNKALPYPIKVAKYRESVYEGCPSSKGDPMQGCY